MSFSLRNIELLISKTRGKRRGAPPVRLIARRADILSSGRELGSSCNGMSMERDLAETRLPATLSLGGAFSGSATPIKPLRVNGAEDFGGA